MKGYIRNILKSCLTLVNWYVQNNSLSQSPFFFVAKLSPVQVQKDMERWYWADGRPSLKTCFVELNCVGAYLLWLC